MPRTAATTASPATTPVQRVIVRGERQARSVLPPVVSTAGPQWPRSASPMHRYHAPDHRSCRETDRQPCAESRRKRRMTAPPRPPHFRPPSPHTRRPPPMKKGPAATTAAAAEGGAPAGWTGGGARVRHWDRLRSDARGRPLISVQ